MVIVVIVAVAWTVPGAAVAEDINGQLPHRYDSFVRRCKCIIRWNSNIRGRMIILLAGRLDHVRELQTKRLRKCFHGVWRRLKRRQGWSLIRGGSDLGISCLNTAVIVEPIRNVTTVGRCRTTNTVGVGEGGKRKWKEVLDRRSSSLQWSM